MSAFTVLRRAAAPGTDAVSRATPPAGPDSDDELLPERGRVARRVIILAVISYSLLDPAFSALANRVTPAHIFLVAGSLVFIPLVSIVAIGPASQRTATVPWGWLLVINVLGITLFEVGGGNWLPILAITAAACGRFSASVWPATAGAVIGVAAGLTMAVRMHAPEGQVGTVLLLPPLAAFFAYSAGSRLETLHTLRRTRAELARIAVSEERLRIARDMHDLLGHSLSLITLKAELARRMIPADPDRASREMAELETVARQSLSDVREAVAGYRQPDLAAELAAARQLLTAAGVACTISAPDEICLPSEVDAVLAWTVREGVTNVVRHAAASSAVITITATGSAAVAEIADDGAGRPPGQQQPGDQPRAPALAGTGQGRQDGATGTASARSAGSAGSGSAAAGPAGPSADQEVPAPGIARLRATGSGLAGLAERVRELGGDLAAGRGTPRGFRLRVTLPLAAREAR
jgi:two-component system sensor histidine kinase DesK